MGIGTINYRLRAPRRWLPDWQWINEWTWQDYVIFVVTLPLTIAAFVLWIGCVVSALGPFVYLAVMIVRAIFF